MSSSSSGPTLVHLESVMASLVSPTTGAAGLSSTQLHALENAVSADWHKIA